MGEGDAAAAADLYRAVYSALRVEAQAAMRRQRRDHTLQPTALVNEAVIKLVQNNTNWESRTHFLAVAAVAMRNILVDYARTRNRRKRTAGGRRLDLEPHLVAFEDRAMDIRELDAALKRLAKDDPRATRVVELRFFGGMKPRAIAKELGVTARTVERDWAYARARLHRELR
jgi:RNA polymerase sigma factor (TIGR02999 family)